MLASRPYRANRYIQIPRVEHPDLSTQFIGGTSDPHLPSSIAPRKHPQRANRTQAGSLCYINAIARHRGCTARAPGMALGHRSTVRKANVA